MPRATTTPTTTWLWRISIGLAVGAIATPLLAWAIAARGSGGPPSSTTAAAYRDAASNTLIRVQENRWFGIHLRYAMRATGPESLPIVDRPSWVPSDFRDDQVFRLTHFGWPFAAFETTDRTQFGPPPSATSSLLNFTQLESPRVWIVDVLGASYRLPYIPNPAGFAANIALWAAVYVTLVTTIAAARAHLRRRRRRCLNCNYSLKGLPPGAPCPECGATPPPPPLPRLPPELLRPRMRISGGERRIATEVARAGDDLG